jgi:hypothetical protein
MELKRVKRALVEVHEFGHVMGIGFDLEGDLSIAFDLPIKIAQDLIDGLWNQGLRPRPLEHELFESKPLVHLLRELVKG